MVIKEESSLWPGAGREGFLEGPRSVDLVENSEDRK